MKAYNIKFIPHKRTSIWIEKIADNIVYADNKTSAKELGQAIVRDYYETQKGRSTEAAEKYTKLYKYEITAE